MVVPVPMEPLKANGKKNVDGKTSVDNKEIVVILHGKRVNVTSWAKRHPGGRKVLHIYNGRDATEAFEAMHTDQARKLLSGMSKKSEEHDPKVHGDALGPSPQMAKEFAELKELLTAKGFFKTNWFDEILKAALVFLPQILGIYMMHTTAWSYTGAFLFAMGVQQAGWVAHDYSHHSVFKSPVVNDAFARFFGFVQGYELQWWKARHNTHHVVTNEVGNDPDIKTAPLFVYFRKKLNAIQKYQHIYFVPMLTMLDVYWRVESLMFITSRLPKMLPHLGLLLLNYVYCYFVFSPVGWGPAILYTLVKGFTTAVVVFSTHYAEERVPKGHHYGLAEQSARASRNVKGGLLIDYFTGFISRQVEHHMFPTMPRCNLPATEPYVKAFLAKHGVPFNEDSLWGCVKRNIDALRP
eukprot:Colp12_sorted_trinity150504_noHs@32663